LAAEVLGVFLDWQWNDYLSVQVPNEYLEELKGITAGARAAGLLKHDAGVLSSRAIVLANFPGTISNINLIIKDELTQLKRVNVEAPISSDDMNAMFEKLGKRWLFLMIIFYLQWTTVNQKKRKTL
jgi:hypothetical protein